MSIQTDKLFLLLKRNKLDDHTFGTLNLIMIYARHFLSNWKHEYDKDGYY